MADAPARPFAQLLVNPPLILPSVNEMQLRKLCLDLVLTLTSCCMPTQLHAAQIVSGDVLVDRTGPTSFGTGSNAAAFEILDVNPTTPALVQTFASTQLPGSPGGQMFSTTAQPLANLSLSDGGTEVSFAGWRAAGTAGTLGTTQGILRGVGTLDANGQATLPATYNPAVLGETPNQPHTAYSPDGVNWYFGDTNGMYYNNGTAKLTGSDGTLSIKGFGSHTYALHVLPAQFLPDQNLNPSASTISLVTPSTPGAGTITYSPVISINPTLGPAMHDFYLLSSAGNDTLDTLYATTDGGIVKYALIAGVWTSKGNASLAGASGIAAEPAAGGGVTLFVTANNLNNPTSGPSVLDELTDTAAFNATFAPSATALLYTAPVGDELHGVSLAPSPVPEPASLILLALGSLGLLVCRRLA
jgi:hypothetical protein